MDMVEPKDEILEYHVGKLGCGLDVVVIHCGLLSRGMCGGRGA